eukprot:TRINITY_DN6517_c0_g1_i1.p1 TRINITY_DN6517_c0_g1~~TRINITY_DN6517_c0_g1_i1.p1  ORF type:complete len:104 (-),score=6.00 TRINITY_DN6517_c0_g1_i1:108-419(-)
MCIRDRYDTLTDRFRYSVIKQRNLQAITGLPGHSFIMWGGGPYTLRAYDVDRPSSFKFFTDHDAGIQSLISYKVNTEIRLISVSSYIDKDSWPIICEWRISIR